MLSLQDCWPSTAAVLHIKIFNSALGRMAKLTRSAVLFSTCAKQDANLFSKAEAKRLPDILIPGQWAIEAKIIRPFGDNGRPAEHWSENILHPYPGNTSSLGDCMKLLQSGLPERKGIIVFGYEHEKAVVPLDPAIHSFELLAAEIIHVELSKRIERRIERLCHRSTKSSEFLAGKFSAENRQRGYWMNRMVMG